MTIKDKTLSRRTHQSVIDNVSRGQDNILTYNARKRWNQSFIRYMNSIGYHDTVYGHHLSY